MRWWGLMINQEFIIRPWMCNQWRVPAAAACPWALRGNWNIREKSALPLQKTATQLRATTAFEISSFLSHDAVLHQAKTFYKIPFKDDIVYPFLFLRFILVIWIMLHLNCALTQWSKKNQTFTIWHNMIEEDENYCMQISALFSFSSFFYLI